jgi:hypothetical protein
LPKPHTRGQLPQWKSRSLLTVGWFNWNTGLAQNIFLQYFFPIIFTIIPRYRIGLLSHTSSFLRLLFLEQFR